MISFSYDSFLSFQGVSRRQIILFLSKLLIFLATNYPVSLKDSEIDPSGLQPLSLCPGDIDESIHEWFFS